MADTARINEKNQEYFRELEADFITSLVNRGIREENVRQFLAKKGVYMLDADLIAHCINMGAKYEKPINFIPDIDEQIDGESQHNYNDLFQGLPGIRKTASA